MLKKDITFIYSDTAEKAIYLPIVEVAKKRGYNTKLTDNPFEKCENGEIQRLPPVKHSLFYFRDEHYLDIC